MVRNREFACNKQFLLFSQCFLPYMALIFHFKCTLKCCLQFVSIWTSPKFCGLVMSKGIFLPSLVQIGPAVREEKVFKEIVDDA